MKRTLASLLAALTLVTVAIPAQATTTNGYARNWWVEENGDINFYLLNSNNSAYVNGVCGSPPLPSEGRPGQLRPGVHLAHPGRQKRLYGGHGGHDLQRHQQRHQDGEGLHLDRRLLILAATTVRQGSLWKQGGPPFI